MLAGAEKKIKIIIIIIITTACAAAEKAAVNKTTKYVALDNFFWFVAQ